MSEKKIYWAYGLLGIYTFGPWISLFLLGVIWKAFGCGAPSMPCGIMNTLLGSILVTMGSISAILPFFTFPTGVLALIVFSIIVYVRLFWYKTPLK